VEYERGGKAGLQRTVERKGNFFLLSLSPLLEEGGVDIPTGCF